MIENVNDALSLLALAAVPVGVLTWWLSRKYRRRKWKKKKNREPYYPEWE